MVRNIKKSLAGIEDLATGIDTVQQDRGILHRVNVFPSSYSYIAMQQYEDGDFFRLYGSDTYYTDYRRNPTGAVGIPAGAGGVWEPLLSNDKSVGGNSTDGAYLVDDSYVFWHAGTASYYGWTGSFPHVVSPNTNPAGNADCVPRTDITLRNELATEGSGVSVSGTNVYLKYSAIGAIVKSLFDINNYEFDARGFGVAADGVTNNTTAMVNAIAAAITYKAKLKLPKGVILVDADALVIGDGSSTQPSTKQALILEGSGFAPYTRDGTVIKARTSGNALLTINGLIEGLGLTNLQFDCAGIVNEGIVSTAVVGFSWDGFGVYDWKDNGLNFKNRALPSGGVTWSRTNSFRRFFITSTYNRDYSSGIRLSGVVDPTNPPGPHDMHNSIFELGTIQMAKRPAAKACQGLYLGFTDSNQFREVDVIMTGTGYGYSATFTDENNVGQPYPQNNLFVGCSLGGDAPRVIGTPGKNYFFHYAMKDGESMPSNTTYLLGMTDEGKFFGPHGFDVINTMLKLKGATTNERALVFETPDGSTAAKIIHNSTLGLEIHTWNGSGYVLASRYHPDGSIYMNFPAIGFKKIEYGAPDSGGVGFRALRIAN